MELKAFLSGKSFDAHTWFGAHFEGNGVVFRVYAPRAARVTLEGDFNGWQEWDAESAADGVWTFRAPYARHGQNYKYCVYSRAGKRTERADPYGFGMGGYGCSVIRDISSYPFQDGAWMAGRTLNFDRPMAIYELHLASWRTEREPYPTYDGIADRLIAYLKENHYTHVEFLPLNEHPMDGSWGYQATGFFSPTARFGEAWQLMYLIDRLHQAGIGAIADYVCVHFAVDRYGLQMFDGTALYESGRPAERRSEWGSYFFDHTQGVVRSFLQSAANYWLSVYHFDGLRFDAVSHLIFSHGQPQQGENAGGLAFLRSVNRGLGELHPTAMRIAEDSTAYPGVTGEGGLGFHYKWALGWTHDTMEFFRKAPGQRDSRSLTVGLDYFHRERFLLPISHDLIGSSGRSFTARMPGDARDRVREMKLLCLLTMAHPGKKLFFLGSELGTQVAWSPFRGIRELGNGERALKQFRAFCNDLNQIYLTGTALFQTDYVNWGSRWVCADDYGSGIFALIRHSPEEHILLVMNTSGQDREHWFPLDGVKEAELLLHSQWSRYGGKVSMKEDSIRVQNGWVGVQLPRLSGILAEVKF